MIKVLLILLSLYVFDQLPKTGNTNWQSYELASELDTSAFNSKAYREIQGLIVDSTRGLISIAAFYLSENDENVQFSDVYPELNFYPAASQSYFIKDTLFLNTGVGFFAGIGVTLKITKQTFSTSTIITADQQKVFKASGSDKNYLSDLEMKVKKQDLKLSAEPVLGKLVVGVFEAEYEPYLEKSGSAEEQKKIKIKIVFRIKPEMVLP